MLSKKSEIVLLVSLRDASSLVFKSFLPNKRSCILTRRGLTYKMAPIFRLTERPVWEGAYDCLDNEASSMLDQKRKPPRRKGTAKSNSDALDILTSKFKSGTSNTTAPSHSLRTPYSYENGYREMNPQIRRSKKYLFLNHYPTI